MMAKCGLNEMNVCSQCFMLYYKLSGGGGTRSKAVGKTKSAKVGKSGRALDPVIPQCHIKKQTKELNFSAIANKSKRQLLHK